MTYTYDKWSLLWELKEGRDFAQIMATRILEEVAIQIDREEWTKYGKKLSQYERTEDYVAEQQINQLILKKLWLNDNSPLQLSMCYT